jgi:hypothetical protein
MASSQRIESTTAQQATEIALAPHCPNCGSAMVVRAQRHGDEVNGLYWGCKRPLVCNGTRRIRDPLVITPTADASTQAIFEWERSRDRRGWVGGEEQVATGRGGFFGRFGRQPDPRPTYVVPAATSAPGVPTDSPLDALPDYGFVVLDHRVVASAHTGIAHLVVGPTGVFAVDRKPWTGQLSSSADSVYVDGRQRTDATDVAVRAAAAVEQILGYELKPLGATVRPVVVFDGATNRSFEATVGKVSLAATRSVAKVIRSGQDTLGPETVVRLSLAADRLLD